MSNVKGVGLYVAIPQRITVGSRNRCTEQVCIRETGEASDMYRFRPMLWLVWPDRLSPTEPDMFNQPETCPTEFVSFERCHVTVLVAILLISQALQGVKNHLGYPMSWRRSHELGSSYLEVHLETLVACDALSLPQRTDRSDAVGQGTLTPQFLGIQRGSRPWKLSNKDMLS